MADTQSEHAFENAPNRRDLEAQAEADAAEIVQPYLHPEYSANVETMAAVADDDDINGDAASERSSMTGQQSSLLLQGGDVHRNIYRSAARSNSRSHHRRAATFSYPAEYGTADGVADDDIASVADIRAPGGFRRHYISQQKSNGDFLSNPVTRTFYDFLDLYGHFAGEDLTGSGSDDEDAESAADSTAGDETRPLLNRRRRRQGSQKRKKIQRGDSGQVKTFFTLLKAFIGTGIMFLPKAFNNGGIIFSSFMLVGVSLLTTLCFHLLLKCRLKHGGSGYGDLGTLIAGNWLRKLILGSITISQFGFVCSSLVFTAENVLASVDAYFGKENQPVSKMALIFLQLLVLIPFSYVRNMSKLGIPAIVADVLIFVGLIYIWYYDIAAIATRGIDKTVEFFNSSAYTQTIGSCIFTFEGIGLLLPIQSSMREPEKFEPLLLMVMTIITSVFLLVGLLSYATFGENTKIEVLSNFPQTSRLVNLIQFFYAIAVLVGAPVQLFPAIRILEQRMFGERSGKRRLKIKWMKNCLRSGLAIACAVVAWVGSRDLDKFVALIGSIACVPLVYMYPPYLHYRSLATRRVTKYADILLLLLGFVGMIYTTSITLKNWVEEEQGGSGNNNGTDRNNGTNTNNGFYFSPWKHY